MSGVRLLCGPDARTSEIDYNRVEDQAWCGRRKPGWGLLGERLQNRAQHFKPG